MAVTAVSELTVAAAWEMSRATALVWLRLRSMRISCVGWIWVAVSKAAVEPMLPAAPMMVSLVMRGW